jgi:hypothetical protein
MQSKRHAGTGVTRFQRYAQPSCCSAHVSGQIFVMCRILSPSNSITYT